MAILAIIGAFLYGDGRWLHWLAKPATTLLIAAIAWRVRDPAQPTYRRAVLAGMLLSCVGDIALMLPMDAFVPGLVAFLLAHVCYIVAFRDGLRAGRGLLAPASCWRPLPYSMCLACGRTCRCRCVCRCWHTWWCWHRWQRWPWHGSGAARSPVPWKPEAPAGLRQVHCCSSPAIPCWPGTASPVACRWPACWCCPRTMARSTPSPAR